MTRSALLISNRVYHYRVAIYNHLQRRLREQGLDLQVLTNDVQTDSPHGAKFDLTVAPFSFADYKAKIRKAKPAVVILFMHIRDVVVWPLLWWLRRQQIPVIYWNHGVNLQTPDNKLKNAIFGLFHRFSDAILLYSKNEKKYIANRHHKKVFIANNTLDFSTMPVIDDDKSVLKARWEIEFDQVVLFVGRITPEKRLPDLLAIADRLPKGTGVVVVGGGADTALLQQMAESARVRYMGEIYEVLDINRLFKLSDVFCIPGKNGLGINQAMYWGLPVVTQDVRHSPEIIYLRNGVNGFIVDDDGGVSLLDRLSELLSNDAMYRQFSAAARHEIATSASIDTMCDGFVEAIDYVRHAA